MARGVAGSKYPSPTRHNLWESPLPRIFRSGYRLEVRAELVSPTPGEAANKPVEPTDGGIGWRVFSTPLKVRQLTRMGVYRYAKVVS
jgi:hypothetical protein